MSSLTAAELMRPRRTGARWLAQIVSEAPLADAAAIPAHFNRPAARKPPTTHNCGLPGELIAGVRARRRARNTTGMSAAIDTER